MAPVRARMASKSVVLPLAKGPTMAMHFGPVHLPPARLPIMPDLLLVDSEAAAGLSGRRDAEGLCFSASRYRHTGWRRGQGSWRMTLRIGGERRPGPRRVPPTNGELIG